MYEFYLSVDEQKGGGNKYAIKNCYEELSEAEFILLNKLIRHFKQGLLSLIEVKTLFVLHLLGFNIQRLNYKAMRNVFTENIYRLTREISFFYRIVYEDEKKFSALSSALQQQLKTMFPSDLPETPETRVAAKMKRHIVIYAEFGKNIIPSLKIGRTKYTGYTFNITDGLATTSLTALQFAEAQKVVQQYAQTQSNELLNLLCSILYSPVAGLYSENHSAAYALQFKKVANEVKESILLNFCAIINFIVHKTKYSILFLRPQGKKEEKKKTYSLGLVDNMYMLSKKGYGDSLQMENSNLFKFFDLLIKELKDNVQELERAGKTKPEIAEALNLTITEINELS